MGRKRHLKRDKGKIAEQRHRDAVLKALKDFQRQGSFKGRPPKLADMLSDESDRGAVILVGSLIEDLLADRIIEELPNGEAHRESLLRIGGVLNSFQDKLTMGLVLGVIVESFAENLETLRAMRNACAHSKVDINFATPVLLDALCLLIDEEAAKDLKKANQEFARVIFNFSAVWHFEILLGATLQQANATFNWMLADATQRARAEAAKRKASLEKRRARLKKGDPPKGQKGPTR